MRYLDPLGSTVFGPSGPGGPEPEAMSTSPPRRMNDLQGASGSMEPWVMVLILHDLVYRNHDAGVLPLLFSCLFILLVSSIMILSI